MSASSREGRAVALVSSEENMPEGARMAAGVSERSSGQAMGQLCGATDDIHLGDSRRVVVE